MVMHQEKIVHIPGCPTDNNLLCPLDVFKEIFKNSIDANKCQFEQVCQFKNEENSSQHRTPLNQKFEV